MGVGRANRQIKKIGPHVLYGRFGLNAYWLLWRSCSGDEARDSKDDESGGGEFHGK